MPDWAEEQIVLVSAIEHYSYCPRQCALIHVEHIFEENIFTLRGSMVHERTDQPIVTCENGVRIERALPIWSDNFGLQGQADVVEFHPNGDIYPVEYKLSGKRFAEHPDLQLCAQALCLEEMLEKPILRGAIYSASSKNRREVTFDEDLRKRTCKIIEEIRELLHSEKLPEPLDNSKCPNCSLVMACAPSVVSSLNVEWDLFKSVNSEVPE